MTLILFDSGPEHDEDCLDQDLVDDCFGGLVSFHLSLLSFVPELVPVERQVASVVIRLPARPSQLFRSFPVSHVRFSPILFAAEKSWPPQISRDVSQQELGFSLCS